MEREQRIAQGLPVDDDVNGDYDAAPPPAQGQNAQGEGDERDEGDDREARDQHDDGGEGEDRYEEQPQREDVESRRPEREPEPVPTSEPGAPAEAEEAPPAKKKRGGGRRSASASSAKSRSKRPSSRSAKPAAAKSATTPAIPDVPVVKTGSADKHLADDEPVDPQPSRRPRKGYDLDEISDDYD
jgi:hypothetical protein